MNYNVKGTGLQVTDELRTYVERQLAHADKLCAGDSTAHADVELQVDEQHDPVSTSGKDSGKYRTEFTVECGGTVYRAESWGSTMHESIDRAAGELLHEMRQTKSKRLHTFRHTAVKVKEYLRGWRKSV